MFRILFLMCSLVALSACSSGGGSGGSVSSDDTTGVTTQEPKPFVVSAGQDRIVTVLEDVFISSDVKVVNADDGGVRQGSTVTITHSSGNYEVIGSSTVPSDIVKLSWTRLEGPAFSIHRNDYTSGNFSFIAPEVETGYTVDIVYEITITNAAGQTVSDTVKITVKRAANDPYPETNEPVLSGDPLIFTSENELVDTSELPSPLAIVMDSLGHQSDLAVEAEIGFFKFGFTTVLSTTGGAEDCPRRGTTTCPYFDVLKIAPGGEISFAKWAYYPVQKKWVALYGDERGLKFTEGDITFDGASWSMALTPPGLRPQVQDQITGPWLYKYSNGNGNGNGNVEYKLKLTASSIAGQEVDGAAGVVYPEDAKTVTLSFEQVAGVLYALERGGFWSSSLSDDGKKYPSVAALRAAHTTTNTPLCLNYFDASALIYFDSTMHAAGISDTGGVCDKYIKNRDTITAVASGVITLADRTLIAVQIPDNLFGSEVSARDKQVLAIVGLDGQGHAANGLAYFPGYINTIDGYYNYAAFKAWLDTVTTDAEAQILP